MAIDIILLLGGITLAILFPIICNLLAGMLAEMSKTVEIHISRFERIRNARQMMNSARIRMNSRNVRWDWVA